MNILFLDQFNSLGGAQQCLLDLLPAMREYGWSARVAIPDAGPLAAKLETMGIPTDAIRCGPYSSARKTLRDFARFAWETPLLARRIERLAVLHQARLLYVNGPRVLAAAAIAARRRRLPLIFHCHVRLGQSAALRMAGWALQHSKATLIGCCEFAAEPLRPYVLPRNLHVIYNGTSDFAAEDSHPAENPDLVRIGIIGRIEPDKGQLEFVQAARLLLDEFPNLRFSITGAPLFSSPAYFEAVREASKGLPFEFEGWRDNVAGAFSSLHVLAVPSAAHDPNPRVILEAFSARVPVVAFRSGGIPEVIEDGVTGFLTAARTPQALAARLQDVLRLEPKEREQVAANARRTWEQNYTAPRYRRQIAERIAQVLS